MYRTVFVFVCLLLSTHGRPATHQLTARSHPSTRQLGLGRGPLDAVLRNLVSTIVFEAVDILDKAGPTVDEAQVRSVVRQVVTNVLTTVADVVGNVDFLDEYVKTPNIETALRTLTEVVVRDLDNVLKEADELVKETGNLVDEIVQSPEVKSALRGLAMAIATGSLLGGGLLKREVQAPNKRAFGIGGLGPLDFVLGNLVAVIVDEAADVLREAGPTVDRLTDVVNTVLVSPQVRSTVRQTLTNVLNTVADAVGRINFLDEYLETPTIANALRTLTAVIVEDVDQVLKEADELVSETTNLVDTVVQSPEVRTALRQLAIAMRSGLLGGISLLKRDLSATETKEKRMLTPNAGLRPLAERVAVGVDKVLKETGDTTMGVTTLVDNVYNTEPVQTALKALLSEVVVEDVGEIIKDVDALVEKLFESDGIRAELKSLVTEIVIEVDELLPATGMLLFEVDDLVQKVLSSGAVGAALGTLVLTVTRTVLGGGLLGGGLLGGVALLKRDLTATDDLHKRMLGSTIGLRPLATNVANEVDDVLKEAGDTGMAITELVDNVYNTAPVQTALKALLSDVVVEDVGEIIKDVDALVEELFKNDGIRKQLRALVEEIVIEVDQLLATVGPLVNQVTASVEQILNSNAVASALQAVVQTVVGTLLGGVVPLNGLPLGLLRRDLSKLN